MKIIILWFALFAFVNASSQVKEALEEMENARLWDESFFKNVLGKELPDFSARDLGGKTYTKKTIKHSKVTFINFWFLSCVPCIAEIPSLNRLYNKVKGNLNFQFFTITYESEEHVKEAIKKYDIHFPVLMVSPLEVRELIFERGYPTSMVLDGKWKIRSILSSGSTTEPGPEFELYWSKEMNKVLRGDTLIEIPKKISDPRSKSDIIFINSKPEIQSLDALANTFKEQSLYIDLWASWCLSCRQEFTIKNSVDSFLSKHKIARIFISLDNPNGSASWKNLVYQYHLAGYHLIAGDELIQDLKQKIYKKDVIELPRYIIIKNGRIVELNAFRPSDGEKLLKQLTDKLL